MTNKCRFVNVLNNCENVQSKEIIQKICCSINQDNSGIISTCFSQASKRSEKKD